MRLTKKLLLFSLLFSPLYAPQESKESKPKFRIEKYLEQLDTTKIVKKKTKAKTISEKKFSIKSLTGKEIEKRKSALKEGLEESLENFSSLNFTSSDNKSYVVYFSINNYDIDVRTKEFVPPYVIDEAKFVIAFDKFIEDNFGSRYNFIKSIDNLVENIDNEVNSIISAAAFGNAIRELGEMAAINIYYGGLGGKENKAFLQRIASNYIANIAYDISTYYGFSSTSIGGKIVAEIIKTTSSLFLTRNLYSDDDITKAIVEDVEAGFFAQIAMGKRMMQEAKEKIKNADSYSELRDAYEKYRYGKIAAFSALKGLNYLEQENFANKIAGAIGSIIGSWAEREIEKSLSREWKQVWNLFKSARYELSEDQKRQKIEQAFKQGFVGEALRVTKRKADDLVKEFWFVDMYNR